VGNHFRTLYLRSRGKVHLGRQVLGQAKVSATPGAPTYSQDMRVFNVFLAFCNIVGKLQDYESTVIQNALKESKSVKAGTSKVSVMDSA
jgi:hypothetical protein